MNEFITTPSGLQYIIHEKGKGPKPVSGDKVTVHYVGKLMNDTVFDSSYKRGMPFSFTLGQGQVIKGWDEGIALLNEGDSATFIIPPAIGYGANSAGKIPPNSTLRFTVQLVKVEAAPKVELYDTKGKDTLTTSSGLKYIIVSKGDKKASQAVAGSIVKVHYTGYFEDGKIFDSSVKRGEPIKFTLGKGQVIKGWDEGIALMKVGDKMRLIIPYTLAYGENGRPPVIPAKATLIFDVELIEVTPEIKPEVFNTAGKDTVKLPSGLQYIMVKEGTKKDMFAQNGQVVKVHYTGYFEDGKIFDSSVQRGEPFSFTLGQGQVIKGWDEGIGQMRVGEKVRFLIPYNLAYGEKGFPGAIPPKANLIFDVELLEVK